MRNRLTYANVIATLALFFALTGSTWAATSKYLMASDPITQGDLAGSTFGNPVMAAGKVTTSKIADGAITSTKFDASATAPNSAKLGGRTADGFGRVLARGVIDGTSLGLLDPGQCKSAGQSPAPDGVDPRTDFILVGDPEGPAPLRYVIGSMTGRMFNGQLVTSLAVLVCNSSSGQISAAGNYPFMILR
jgi:hypothetical protein